ncbi:MAG: hypothetical protein KZQ93_09720 [Candidatus Thiodiazotropha sp. (ex Monitilora ramsayi)]|nr:hypothetical protein [Candidatus Thiodiazotropha sp. (ex Monitilora ramsayi)]
MKRYLMAGAIAFVCASATAFAGGMKEAGGMMHKGFEQLDMDKSGTLNREEGMAREDVKEYWRDIDFNMDGVVDQSEFSAFELEIKEEADEAK